MDNHYVVFSSDPNNMTPLFVTTDFNEAKSFAENFNTEY